MFQGLLFILVAAQHVTATTSSSRPLTVCDPTSSPGCTDWTRGGGATSSVLTSVGQSILGVATANASMGGAIALGAGAVASNFYAIAIGKEAVADGKWSAALSQNSIAFGSSSVSIGAYSNASGRSSTTLGNGGKASGAYATTIGPLNSAPGQSGIAMGDTTVAKCGATAQSDGLFGSCVAAGTALTNNELQAFAISGNIHGRNVHIFGADERLSSNIAPADITASLQRIEQINVVVRSPSLHACLGLGREDVSECVSERSVALLSQQVSTVMPRAVHKQRSNGAGGISIALLEAGNLASKEDEKEEESSGRLRDTRLILEKIDNLQGVSKLRNPISLSSLPPFSLSLTPHFSSRCSLRAPPTAAPARVNRTRCPRAARRDDWRGAGPRKAAARPRSKDRGASERNPNATSTSNQLGT